ncbi:pyridoxine 5'-phosphate synthase [Pseudobacteriovorax antillogorgiicola]|uniref:Pyridoxine 5'-phosphate synthase n=1 Tax=Pseudobacteriovorax antillogorgiicola TaxID=1513793 RepID=A0A1Y6CKR0_9BACT|nr:pyridoxine 5'-phosphate synthase [Pseudobacteriovorax antillogorgiicola]TCS46158.1 pyridoxine 5'-phosphate synthase [Pseudobacteriovorax antillogorgiicola]SMF69867.1 pyridoxine 5'-phosphate synthase [Pseudobacteriovorax antillogorgiicola]
MIRLGVNLDHVATVRNARGEAYPNPVQAALLAELGGADNITCHLREDRRHIKDRDVELLKEQINVPLNFEMAITDEMVAIAKRVKPHAVTLVPEKRQELTTEGGLDPNHYQNLQKVISDLKEHDMLVSLFVEADERVIEQTKQLGADAIEIHTGNFCHEMDAARSSQRQWELVKPLMESAKQAHEMGLQVHFGHGLHYSNAHWMQAIPFCEEANIGHAIISRAIYVGLESAVREMKSLLNDSRFAPRLKGLD